MTSKCKGAILSVLILAAVPVLGTPGIHAWFVDSLFKVLPYDPPGTHRLDKADFCAGRGQHLSIQVALRSSKPFEHVTADVAAVGEDGEGIFSGAQVRAVGTVVVGSHTKNAPPAELVGEAPGWYPDPLWDLPIALARERTASIWVTLPVPTAAAPGAYRGRIELRASGRLLKRLSFRLRVFPARVPEQRTLKITNWVNLGDKTSNQFYGIPQFSDEWWTLVENMGRVLADHRQNVIYTQLLELVEARADNGKLAFGFDRFDRWVETFRRAGVIGFIEGSHLLDRAGSYDAPLVVHTLQPEGAAVRTATLPPDDPGVEAFLTAFLPALNEHLERKGWKSIYFQHILDEPHGAEPPYYARFGDMVRRLLPGVATMDAMDAATLSEELKRSCDVWVPQLGQFDGQMDLIRGRVAAGHEVWFYTCLFPTQRYLNRMIDFPLLKVRLLHWLNFRLGLAGYLHWGGNYWTPEPVNDTQPVIDANTELLPAGDAFIVYPDRERRTVFSSIRLEAMREGIEDYELLLELQGSDPAAAERICREAVSSFTDYVREPAQFRRIERELLEALSK